MFCVGCWFLPATSTGTARVGSLRSSAFFRVAAPRGFLFGFKRSWCCIVFVGFCRSNLSFRWILIGSYGAFSSFYIPASQA